jgi:hypothetical protein
VNHGLTSMDLAGCRGNKPFSKSTVEVNEFCSAVAENTNKRRKNIDLYVNPIRHMLDLTPRNRPLHHVTDLHFGVFTED